MEDKKYISQNNTDHPEKDAVKLFGGVVILAIIAIIVGLITKDGRNFLLGLVNPENTIGISININSIPGTETVETGILGVGIAKTYEEFSTEEGWLNTLIDLVDESGATIIRYPVGGEVKWHHVWTDYLEQDLLAEESSNLKMGPTGINNEIPGLGELYADRAYEEIELGNDGEINELMGNKSKYNSYADLNGDGAKSFFDFQWSQPRNFMHDMIDINEETNTPMLYVVNTRYATPQEVAQEVEYLIDQGVDIQGYECDNEVYSFYRDLYPGNPAVVAGTAVEAYLDTCDTYRSEIEEVDPTAVFAVAAAPKKGFEEGGGVGDTDSDWNGQWNASLTTKMGEHGYDNYVMHFYHGFFPCIDEVQTGNKDSVFSCGVEEMRNFYSETPPSFASQITSIPPILDHFAALFPGKEMWLTEWNINQDPTRTNGLYANSILHGIFTQEFLNLLNDANTRHDNFIKYANYHTFGTDGGNAMVNKRSDGAGAEPSDIGNFVRRTPFFAYKAMKNIYDGDHTFLATDVTFDTPGLINANDIKIYAYENTDGEITMSVSNTTNKTIVLNSITINGEIVNKEETSLDIYFTDGNDNSSSKGKTEFAKNPGNEVVIREESYDSISDAFIPAYGFGSVSFVPVFETDSDENIASPDNNTNFTGEIITYATTPAGTSLKFDLSKPIGAQNPLPLIFFLHGGAFETGGLTTLNDFVADFTGAGYAVAEVEYRGVDEDLFPAQVQDINGAIRYVRANAAGLGIDPDKIAIAGSSSGGMLMSLVGTSSEVNSFEGTTGGNTTYSSKPNAVVNLFGSLDPDDVFGGMPTGIKTTFMTLFGCVTEESCDQADQAAAANYADENDPPFLTLHGTADAGYQNSVKLQEIFIEAGIDSTLISAPGVGHDKTAILNLHTNDIISFLDDKLYSGENTDEEEPTDTSECGFFENLFGGCDEEVILEDEKEPQVTIVSPANKETVVTGLVEIHAKANDPSGISKIDFYQGETLIGTDTEFPYKIGWDTTILAPGMYSLRAVAHDNAGNFATANIKVRK